MKNNRNFNFDENQKQSHGFSVPENYFDSVENAVFAKISESSFPKETGFSVPNNYFETVDKALYKSLNIVHKEPKVISLRTRMLKYIPTAAAASILLFVGLNYMTLSDSISFESISSDEVENWINNNYLNQNPNNFRDQFVDADFTENALLDDNLTITDQDIMDYFNTIDNKALLTEIEL